MKKSQSRGKVHLTSSVPTFWAVIIGLSVIAGGVCRTHGSGDQPTDREYKSVLASVTSARPSAVDVSPNGRYIMTKERDENGFRLAVFDQVSKRFIYTPAAQNTQYGVAWRPDNEAFAYQESSGPDRPLCLFDLASGKTTRPDVPVSRSALLPAQWSPNGKFLVYFDGDWRGGRLLSFDPESGGSPNVIEEGIVPDYAAFAWSPDSASIAVVPKANSGIIVKDLAGNSRIQVDVGGEVRTIAWSPDGRSFLAMVRGLADKYFVLVEISLKTGQILRKVDDVGDISNPIWLQDGKSFVYQLTSDQTARAVLYEASGERRLIGPTNGVLELTHLSSDRKFAYARYAGFTQPLSLVQISLRDGSYRQIYAPPLSPEVICPQPEMIHFRSRDGTVIPAYYWHSSGETKLSRAVLIFVHGGPNGKADAVWSPLQYIMSKYGCDVIAVNYRGSTGYGQSFENMGGDSERVWDVLAAKDYAVNCLKTRPRKIFLLGDSYGAALAACAAAQGGEIGGLILVSWPRSLETDGARLHLDRSVEAIELHGAYDMFSPTEARLSMEQFFKAAGDPAGEPRQIVFANEGHFFTKDSSIAREYWLALKMMGLN